MMWAPLNTPQSQGRAPKNCIWRPSVEIPLLWCRAFLHGEAGTLKREFSLSAYLDLAMKISIVMDASPWGLGAILIINGIIREYFHSRLTKHDSKILGHAIGSCEGQQAFEALVMLVALRLWAPVWKDKRVLLAVRSDSVSALTILLKFKSSGDAPSIVARELALGVAGGVYVPNVVQHVPGVANTISDVLSRWYEPKKAGKLTLPPVLKAALRRDCPDRPRGWWRSLRPMQAISK